MDSGLAGNVTLVTGASGGIGAEIARAFCREEARVVLHYHRNRDRAEALAHELADAHPIVVGADLSQEDDVARLWQRAEEALGPVEIVVANAGFWPPDPVPIQRMTLEQWNQTLETNVTSVFLSMREFFRGIERHGIVEPAVVLIGSTAGVFGEADHSDYATAKGGLVHGFLPSLKNEIVRLAPGGRVNAICPGWTATPMTDKFVEAPDAVRRALQTVPLRKLGCPGDVASAALFLASHRLAGHVSGEALMVSGGMEGRVLFAPEEVGEI